MRVPHNRPPVVGREMEYLADAVQSRHLSGDGPYTQRCQAWLERAVGGVARLTHSCTAALEMAALLTEVGPGDEVIMPSFTFVSTANAFVLRGAVPIFVDIDPSTLNIDPARIAEAITPRTRAVVVVHYAGVCADMDAITAVAATHGIPVVEDAAQALMATYRGRPAGGLGALACFSFHETKNLVSGEGGALLINDPQLTARADIIREKGTNRRSFQQGFVDKYSWVDLGSSYLPGELVAAFLLAQLEEAEAVTRRRVDIWLRYQEAFADAERRERVRRPVVPAYCGINGHLYYLLLRDRTDRDAMIRRLGENGILAPFHYVPLHSAPAGLRFANAPRPLPVTDESSARLLRLPLFYELTEQEFVIERVLEHLAGG